MIVHGKSILFSTEVWNRIENQGLNQVVKVVVSLHDIGQMDQGAYLGEAFCSPKDEFDRNKGVLLALGRALDEADIFDKQVRADFFTATRKALRKGYIPRTW